MSAPDRTPTRTFRSAQQPAGLAAHQLSEVEGRSRTDTASQGLWIIVGVALLYAAYFVLRYGGLWTENDTADFTQYSMQILRAGNLFTPSLQYPHGLGYGAWLSALSLLMGVSPPVLNAVILPFVGAILLVTPAFLAYRALLRSGRAGLLATSILFAIPDLMFSVLRGNHEKLNVAFMLAAIYVLLRGFDVMGRGSVRRLAIWVLLFYVLIFAGVATNDYFAAAFVAAATLTLPCVYWLMRDRPAPASRRAAASRLASSVAVSWLIVCWFILYLFPPANVDLHLLAETSRQVQSVLLTLRPSSNPYTAANAQWAGMPAALIFDACRWLLFALSFLVWLLQLRRVLLRSRRLSLQRLLLLAFYGAFGFLVAIAIPVDFAGLSAGTNLELRNFTYFALLGAPLLAWGMRDTCHFSRRERVPCWLAAACRYRTSGATKSLLVLLVLVGLVKATVDPLVSNQWIFYVPAERQALTFYLAYGHGDLLWSGPDNRLAYVALHWSMSRYVDGIQSGHPVPAQPDLLRSLQVEANTIAQRLPLPAFDWQNRVYDDGGAQIYRRTPRTPLQN